MTTLDWPLCQLTIEPCLGSRAEGFDRCLAHLTSDELDLFFGRLQPGADLDGRGTIFTDAVLGSLMKAAASSEVAGRHLGVVNFTSAEFVGSQEFVPLIARELILDGARFEHHAQIEVRADWVSCVGTRFDDGVTLRVSRGAVIAERTVFGAASSIVNSSFEWTRTLDPGREQRWEDAGLIETALLSLRGTDVGNLVVVDVDLSWCLFAGAHRLDQLRFDGDCWFSSPPVKVRGTRRIMLAEEILQSGMRRHPFLTDEHIVFGRVNGLYRSL